MKVNEFKVIVMMNEAMIKLLNNKKVSCEENLRIRECLSDESFFFRTTRENALSVLKSVGIKPEKIQSVYATLTAPSVYYDLLQSGKIQIDDNSLTIKFKQKGHDELFK